MPDAMRSMAMFASNEGIPEKKFGQKILGKYLGIFYFILSKFAE
jgi:hypothetical protein